MKSIKPKPKSRRGPDPERVKIDEDWEKAIEKALKKKRPKEGWPKPESEKSEEKPHSDPE